MEYVSENMETYAADNVIDDLPPSALSTEQLRGLFSIVRVIIGTVFMDSNDQIVM